MDEHEGDFRRPNYLATTSLVLGGLTLMAQVLAVCLTFCTPFLLAFPTVVTLVAGGFGYKQSQQTGVGREQAVIGLALGGVNLLIGLFWIALTTLYGLLVMLVFALGGP